MAHGRTYEADIFLHHREGHRVPVRVKVSPLYDSGNQVVGAVELFSDNTEQMLALERIAELEEAALLDPVTHLANKAYLEFQTQRYLREMVRQVQHVGILLIVIDQFEELCRPLAEAARNQLLQIVAETIRSNGRPLDLFGHVDDGCFVGLLHDVTSQQLYAVARKHHALIEKSHFFTGDQIIDAKVSIGGTMLRMDDTFQAAISRCEKQLMVSHRADGVCQISVELPFDA
jgi:diguanylate cyclase (GGDEF)-like protein